LNRAEPSRPLCLSFPRVLFCVSILYLGDVVLVEVGDARNHLEGAALLESAQHLPIPCQAMGGCVYGGGMRRCSVCVLVGTASTHQCFPFPHKPKASQACIIFTPHASSLHASHAFSDRPLPALAPPVRTNYLSAAGRHGDVEGGGAGEGQGKEDGRRTHRLERWWWFWFLLCVCVRGKI
jgi:hypothetical protein